MKRRQFLQSIAASGAVPALPGAAMMGTTAVTGSVYAKAVYYTRLWGTSVPEMYTSALGLDLVEAKAVFRQLIADNVIAAPNASGIASAVTPFFRSSVAAKVAAEGASGPSGPGLLDHLRKVDTVAASSEPPTDDYDEEPQAEPTSDDEADTKN